MIDLHRILVPTDFSDCAGNALKYGAAFADRFDADLILLHVVQDITLFIPEAVTLAPSVAPPLEEYVNRAQTALRDLVKESGTGHLRITTLVREGAACEEILHQAREKNVDLIIVGTHGRTGLAHLLMGSEAEKVVRQAPCPVLTVHFPEHEFVKDDEEG